jgi:succinate dehydrogenase flavin-adding protein (antitoxin of CptAB toxin-antitoxin module)
MKELDVLLTRWLDGQHATATSARRAAFERLLELPDPDLAACFLGRARPDDPQLANLVDEILADRR